MKSIWEGAMPLKWRSVGYLPSGKTIGSKSECDLFSVIKDGWLEIHPVIPEFSMKPQRTNKCNFIAVLQAQGVDADSNMLQVEVGWDGDWSDDSNEMTNIHVKARKV